MSRVIKFRGISEGKWYYGLLTFMFGSYAVVEPKDENTVHLVDVKTVGQYTGLKDNNGVEIYEGDIISFTTELYIDGVYVEREYVEYVTHEYGAFCLDGLLLGDLSNIDEEIQVIGNIYENPELLEGNS